MFRSIPRTFQTRAVVTWLGRHQFCEDNKALYASLAGFVAATAALQILPQNKQPTKCAGIIGVVGKQCDAREVLIDGLSVLKSRAHDSAGMATMRYDGEGLMSITKYGNASNDPIEMVRIKSLPKCRGHSVGMAHIRWATKGSKSDRNAHPHTDSSGRIALVHNGTLYNAEKLRDWLERKGHVFVGDTDSEVIAKLIGQIYYQEKAVNKCSLREAVEKAMKLCEGTWGLAVMSLDEPKMIVLATHGSPLLIGFWNNNTDEGAVLVSSDKEALSRYTQSIIPLDEGEIVEMDATGVRGGRDYMVDARRDGAFTSLDASNF